MVSSDLLWLLASIDLVFDDDHSRILRSGDLEGDIDEVVFAVHRHPLTPCLCDLPQATTEVRSGLEAISNLAEQDAQHGDRTSVTLRIEKDSKEMRVREFIASSAEGSDERQLGYMLVLLFKPPVCSKVPQRVHTHLLTYASRSYV